MAQLVPAPLRTAIQNAQGGITQYWWTWFSNLFAYLGGFQTFGAFPATSTITGAAGMTIAAIVIHQSEVRQVGTVISFYLDVSFTTGGAASPTVLIALPVPPVKYGQFTARVLDGSALPVPGLAWIDPITGNLLVQRADGANWSLGTLREIVVNGSYTAA